MVREKCPREIVVLAERQEWYDRRIKFEEKQNAQLNRKSVQPRVRETLQRLLELIAVANTRFSAWRVEMENRSGSWQEQKRFKRCLMSLLRVRSLCFRARIASEF